MNAEMLYGCLVVAAFVCFIVVLAVVSEQTETFLSKHDKRNLDG